MEIWLFVCCVCLFFLCFQFYILLVLPYNVFSQVFGQKCIRYSVFPRFLGKRVYNTTCFIGCLAKVHIIRCFSYVFWATVHILQRFFIGALAKVHTVQRFSQGVG